MKTLIIIPARSGSRGVLDKNMQIIGGLSLIERTIKSVVNLNDLNNIDVCFSSDSEKYLDHVRNISNKIILRKRSKLLSSSTALTIDVVKDVINYLGKNFYENVLLLQVTTPFRNIKHIRESLNKFNSNNYESLVSIVNVEGYHPLRMKVVSKDIVLNYIDQGFENMIPRQELPPVYIRNGAVYITKCENIYKHNLMLSGKTGYYEMNSIESINIDSEMDLEFANFIAEKYDL